MKIRYIQHKDIDFVQWDAAIENSICPLIYAFSWYLDAVANKQWDALVYGNYEAVFPLPWKRKYFLKYIYQPFFCQQLGLFAKQDFAMNHNDFIKMIPKTFVLIDLQVNLYAGNNQLQGRLKNNYQLDLKLPYNLLYNNYSQDVKNNLKKIEKRKLKYEFNIPFETVMEINRNAWGDLNPGIKNHHYSQFVLCCLAAKERHQLITIGALQENQIVGAALLFKTSKYLFYILSGKTELGKRTGVMNGIVDKIIETYANSTLVLDFEGSEIQGVAYFYKKFGSSLIPYLHFKKYNIFN